MVQNPGTPVAFGGNTGRGCGKIMTQTWSLAVAQAPMTDTMAAGVSTGHPDPYDPEDSMTFRYHHGSKCGLSPLTSARPLYTNILNSVFLQ